MDKNKILLTFYLRNKKIMHAYAYNIYTYIYVF